MTGDSARSPAADGAVATIDVLGEEVLRRADWLQQGHDLDGVRLEDLSTLGDFLDHVWQGWRMVARHDVGGAYSNGASAVWAIVLLRHDRTGTWLITSLTMSYWTAQGVLHTRWEDSLRGSRLTTVAFHVFGLGKFTHAPTLPLLAERLAAEIAPRLGPNNRSSELDRHIRTARALLALDPATMVAAVDEADQPQVHHEADTMRTMAALGGLGGIEAALAQAAVEHPDV